VDIKAMPEKIYNLIKKYRYALLILAIGLVLMAIPNTADQTKNNISEEAKETHTEPSLEDRLTSILSLVEGAGQVRVILTVAEGEEIVYQTNDNIANTNDSNNKSINTVTITDSQRNQSGLICQINPATYKGIIIVCQGADKPSVRLKLVDAVSKLTGLGTNRISVLKMK